MGLEYRRDKLWEETTQGLLGLQEAHHRLSSLRDALQAELGAEDTDPLELPAFPLAPDSQVCLLRGWCPLRVAPHWRWLWEGLLQKEVVPQVRGDSAPSEVDIAQAMDFVSAVKVPPMISLLGSRLPFLGVMEDTPLTPHACCVSVSHSLVLMRHGSATWWTCWLHIEQDPSPWSQYWGR